MKKMIKMVMAVTVIFCMMVPAFAQSASSDNMQILRDKVKADKKLVVAVNMQLTESESKAFWPVYDAYQKDLAKINQRALALINTYAEAWKSEMDNKAAKKITKEFIALQDDEVKMTKSYAAKLNKILPATKVARYLQIENKIRSVIRYEVASQIPLVPDK